MTDQVTNGIIIGLIPALVFLGLVLRMHIDRQAARNATAPLAESESLLLMPKFTADFDILVEFQGKKYRVYFAVEDVRMVEGE